MLPSEWITKFAKAAEKETLDRVFDGKLPPTVSPEVVFRTTLALAAVMEFLDENFEPKKKKSKKKKK